MFESAQMVFLIEYTKKKGSLKCQENRSNSMGMIDGQDIELTLPTI